VTHDFLRYISIFTYLLTYSVRDGHIVLAVVKGDTIRCVLVADNTELDAQISTTNTRHLRGTRLPRRSFDGDELQNIHISTGQLHRRHGLPKPPGAPTVLFYYPRRRQSRSSVFTGVCLSVCLFSARYRGVAPKWTGVDMSTPLLPEGVPEIDADPLSSDGRCGGGIGKA